ncbi:phosphoethanolamine transferase [Frateuria soli]|uniref:phosphoethanolamine transferase n=1 Tax=Frateuria soli TaxID=1542730 RepID=UPI001E505383|nr:phosphoethanolamine transferase [Frateuria soli]UGB37206.1 phosphoethanolamine transferase [Frateuria soli]
MKRHALASVVVLGLLLIAPNIALVFASTQITKLQTMAASLMVPAALLLGYFAILGHRPWLACLLMAPFAALVPVVTLYILRYRTPITDAVLGTVAATNPEEAAAFLGPWLWALIVLSLVAGVLAVVAGRLSVRAGLQLATSRRLRAALTALALALAITLMGLQAAADRVPPESGTAAAGGVGASVLQLVRNSYPFGIPLALRAWWDDHVRLQVAMAETQDFSFHPRRAAHAAQRQIYVLVIGESSRRDHWQLFGYDRPTNPELSRTRHLIPISDMVSAWPITIGAVPSMLTRTPAQRGLSDPIPERSVVGLMREAGFDTWWISTQSSAGQWSSPVTRYAHEARHVDWLYLQRYDSSLTRTLATVVRQSSGDLFVVLHMMGSHATYASRYPRDFAYFGTPVRNREALEPGYRQIIDSYDNSVRYTDHILRRVIDILDQSHSIAAMWYQSDHGETLPTATCPLSEHGHGSRHEFPVPALFWYSDAYARAFPQHVATLRSNADKRASSADTFATLADMAGVDFPTHDRSRSLFSPAWRYQPRLVHPEWQGPNTWVDYDDADLGNGCEAVRSRARPGSGRIGARPD